VRKLVSCRNERDDPCRGRHDAGGMSRSAPSFTP
jgi:hypothetical protein